LGIQDRAAARQVHNSIEQRRFDPLLDVRGAHAGTSLCPCACRVAGSLLAKAPHFPALGFRYVERALFARHSFTEIKRMHGQKPLRSPGAWQEYLSAAWLPARCPHVHTSRASSGEAPAGRPRTPISGFASCKFLLVTVPRSLCTLAPFSRPGDFVPLSFASAQANVQAPSPWGRLRFPALLLRGMNLSPSLRLCCWNYNPVQPSEPSGRIRSRMRLPLESAGPLPHYLVSSHFLHRR